MTILIKRETLHEVIDDLPESQLFELVKFVEFLLSKNLHNNSNFDLWELAVEDQGDVVANDNSLDDLNEVIQAIQNTPPNNQAIVPPSISWEEYFAELSSESDIFLDVTDWNQTWDTLEVEMKAKSLSHRI